MFPSPDHTSARPITRPLLGMAAALTVAWFAVAAVTIGPAASTHNASGYGVDEFPAVQHLAQR